MKYEPVLPENNSNISHEHPAREFIVLVLGSALLLVAVYFFLGLLVDQAVEYISPEQEMAIFESMGLDSLGVGEAELLDDERTEAVRGLLDELMQCVDVGYSVKLNVMAEDLSNAFAMPGGQMVLWSGLLDQVQSENGLAFVLAHELGHFKNRDHLRSMGRRIVLMALAIVFTGANSDLSKFMAPVSSLEEAQHSQKRERAADATALEIINCHYGHIAGATEFFEAVAKEDIGFDFALSHYFSSHPEAKDRIAAINELMRKHDYVVGDRRARL